MLTTVERSVWQFAATYYGQTHNVTDVVHLDDHVGKSGLVSSQYRVHIAAKYLDMGLTDECCIVRHNMANGCFFGK